MRPRLVAIAVTATCLCALGLGATNASATVLCAANESACAPGNQYGSGTKLQAELEAGTQAVFTAGFATVQCSTSVLAGNTENSGGSSVTVTVQVLTLKLASCNCTVTALANGKIEFHYSDNGDGVLTGKGQEVTITCSGVSCKFGTSSTGTTLGTISGGSPGILHLNASLVWLPGDGSSFVCTIGSGSTPFQATYHVTSPTPLFLAAA